MATIFCMCLLACVLPRPIPPEPGNTDPVAQLTYERDCLELDLRDAKNRLADEREGRNWHALKTSAMVLCWVAMVLFGTWVIYRYAIGR